MKVQNTNKGSLFSYYPFYVVKRMVQIVIAALIVVGGFSVQAYGDNTSFFGQSLDGRDNTMSLVTVDVTTGKVRLFPTLEHEDSFVESVLPPLMVPDAIKAELQTLAPVDDRETVVVLSVDRPYSCDRSALKITRENIANITIDVTLSPDRSACTSEPAPDYIEANLGLLAPGHYAVKATSGDRVYDILTFQVHRAAAQRGLSH